MVKEKEREEWRDIDGFPGYKIDRKGDIISYKSGNPKQMKLRVDKKGYIEVGLHRWRKTERRKIHRLVMYAFGDPSPGDDYQIDHIDCNKQNNDISNLEWVTGAENMRRAIENGLYTNKYVITNDDRRRAVESIEKQIIGFNCLTKESIRFRSASDASRKLNIPRHRIVCSLDGRTIYADDWVFDYAEEDIS